MKPVKYTVVILGVILLLSQLEGAKVKGKKKGNNSNNKSGEVSNESSAEGSPESNQDKSINKEGASSKSTRSTLSQLSTPDELQYHPGGGNKGGQYNRQGGGGWTPPDYGAPHSPHLSGGPSPPPPSKGGQSGGWPSAMVGSQIGFDLGGPGGYSSIIEKGCILVGIGILVIILLAYLSHARGGANQGWENKKIGKKSDDVSDPDKQEHVQLLVKVNDAIEKKFR